MNVARERVQEILLNGLIDGKGHDALFDDISGLLSVDAFVFDLEGKPLYYAPSATLPDFHAVLRNAESIIRADGRSEYTDSVEAYDADGSGFLISMLSTGNIPYAFACVRFSGDALRATATEVLMALPGIAALFSGTESSWFTFSDDYIGTGLAQEILFKKNDGVSGIFARATSIRGDQERFRFLPDFCIAVLTSAERTLLRDAEHALERHADLSPHFIRNGRLYILIHGLRQPEEESRMIGKLEQFASERHLYCGISSAFDNEENSPAFRRQAELAAELAARKGRSLCSVRNDFTELLFSVIRSENAPEVFVLSELKRLEAYDRENRTEYLYTLETYLNHRNKPARTAAHLYIDRSTLAYRLKKISEIAACDPEDPEVAALLRFALAVRRCLE